MRSFSSAKAPHIFSAKNISTLDFRRTRKLNESLTNDFVKLTMLWTTGPRSSIVNSHLYFFQYNYYNMKQRRHEMAVLEMFEGKEQSNATSFSSFTAPAQPLVMRQSFIFPMPLYTIASTLTEKGITSKNIIGIRYAVTVEQIRRYLVIILLIPP